MTEPLKECSWRSREGDLRRIGVEVRSPERSRQIQELLVTLRSLVQATETCLTGVKTEKKETQELIKLAKTLTHKARLLIDVSLQEH